LSCFEKSAPEDLRIDGLLQRITPDVQEIILALDSNMEGQTTLHFLTQELSEKAPWLKISTLARGIPMGGELSYLDQGTLMSAFHGRKDVPRLTLSPPTNLSSS
jgi:recombination protein RecR